MGETGRNYFLSPAPQALPQAEGFFAGVSDAPQAAGASEGLSPEPQAVPQAAAGAVSSFLFHPNRLESAIFMTSVSYSASRSALCAYHYRDGWGAEKYALFYGVRTFL